MNCFNNITPEYSYNYFDEYNQLQTKQLNIFQNFARNVFGCYAETHLSNVAERAYTLTLNDQFQGSLSKQQKLLELIAKAEQVYGYNKVKLPSCFLPSGEEVNIRVRYDIKKPDDSSDAYKISSINFELLFSRNNTVTNISLFKNKSNEILVHLPTNIFHETREDTDFAITTRLNSKYAITINNLVAKILKDSSTAPDIAEVQYYAGDYEWTYRSTTELSLFGTSSKVLNETQKQLMHKLGWEYLKEYRESGKIVPVLDAKRVYLFRKEVAENHQTLAISGYTQQLSTAFAVSHLEAQDRNY